MSVTTRTIYYIFNLLYWPVSNFFSPVCVYLHASNQSLESSCRAQRIRELTRHALCGRFADIWSKKCSISPTLQCCPHLPSYVLNQLRDSHVGHCNSNNKLRKCSFLKLIMFFSILNIIIFTRKRKLTTLSTRSFSIMWNEMKTPVLATKKLKQKSILKELRQRISKNWMKHQNWLQKTFSSPAKISNLMKICHSTKTSFLTFGFKVES